MSLRVMTMKRMAMMVLRERSTIRKSLRLKPERKQGLMSRLWAGTSCLHLPVRMVAGRTCSQITDGQKNDLHTTHYWIDHGWDVASCRGYDHRVKRCKFYYKSDKQPCMTHSLLIEDYGMTNTWVIIAKDS